MNKKILIWICMLILIISNAFAYTIVTTSPLTTTAGLTNESDPFYFSNPNAYYNSTTLMNTNDTSPYLDYIDFNLTSSPAHAEGRLYWNTNEGTLNLGLSGGEVNLQIGQEMVFRARNTQGSTINNGELVYVSGATGSIIEVKLSNATHPQHSLSTLAFATENVSNNQQGYFTTSGLVRDLDTSAYADGTALFLDVTDGQVTDTPVSKGNDNRAVFVGFVVRSHANEGVIFAKIVALPFLDELSDVNNTCGNNQFLVYNATTKLWHCQNLVSTSDIWVNETGDTMTGTLNIESGNGKLVSTNAGGGLDVMTATGGAGYISFGNTADIGISTDGVVGTHNYDGAFIFKQKASNPVQDVEFIFIEEAGDWRFALPSSSADHGTYNPRSMIIAGASVNNESNVHCSYWGFSNLDCDTGGTGADLGVQDDLEVLGKIYSSDWTDVSITESQISDLVHTTDTNETTRVDEIFQNVTNWNTAFGWGDHGVEGYLVSTDLNGYWNSADNETDPFYFSNPNSYYNSTTLPASSDTNETTRVYEILNITDHFGKGTYNVSGGSAYTGTLDDNNLVYYSFDEDNVTGSTMVDLSGNGNDGTCSMASNCDLVDGHLINASDLDGSSDRLSVGYSTASIDDYSLSVWIYHTGSPSATEHIYAYIQNANERVLFRLQSDNNLYLVEERNGNNIFPSGIAYTTYYNSWTHLVVTSERNGYARIYVNGVESSNASVTNNALGMNINADIGARNNIGSHDNYFDGLIDEFSLYDTILNQSQIDELYANGTGFNFNNGEATTTEDPTLTLNRSLDVDGSVYANDFVTKSKVPIIDGKSALDQLSNIDDWSKNGKVQYTEHYAKTKIKENKNLIPIYETTCTDKFDLINLTFYEVCDAEIIGYDEESVVEYGLSMETRVAEMEKMIYELWQEVEKIKIK